MHNMDTGGANAFAHAFDDAEHVLLEAEDLHAPGEALADGDGALGRRDASRVMRRVELRDRARAMSTSLAFHDDGRLELKRRRRGDAGAAQHIDLKYLDPEPAIERRIARRSGRAALASLGVAALAAALAGLGVPGAVTGPIAAAAGTVTVLAGLAFVYLSSERVVFMTRYGRAAALALSATPGSFGTLRKTVPLVVDAIKRARSTLGEETNVYLRREMREHYRLHGEGVLSDEDCSTGTARVLARFDALP